MGGFGMNRLSLLASLFVVPLLSLGFFISPASAQVKDNAQIFSSDAVTKADKICAEIGAHHGKQFVIETFAKVPDDKMDELKNGSADEFFRKWVIDRAKANNV